MSYTESTSVNIYMSNPEGTVVTIISLRASNDKYGNYLGSSVG